MKKTIKDLIEEYKPQPLGEQKQYAVFLPLLWQNEKWHILYEVRSQHISQPGEVSFPGGRVERNESYQTAAIRETVEELNVCADKIDIWGEIDYIVQPRRTIHCFVGQLHCQDWKELAYNEEVDHLFVVPLDCLQEIKPVYYELPQGVKADNNFPFDRIRNGQKYAFSNQVARIPFYEGLEEIIWGMTAQFTDCFIQLIKDNEK
ncbi:NUDIX hydrolase [Streptococcus porcinus]|uniref:NUDIX hydrolase n=1 Tax=Streptococcus porcinus TaxID=1340 RepID=UPI0010CACE6F|nr:NUDIX hydrolase [Streptococcus porcinus]